MTIREMVLGLLDLPGSRYSCVAERESGWILIESGAATVDPAAVLRWGMEASSVLGMTVEGGLEDFILTSSGHYHLVRPLGSDRSLLVYLCVDRARANLASARRELAAARLDDRAQPGTSTMAFSRPPAPARTPLRAVSRTAAAMPPAATPPVRRSDARRDSATRDVPLPRRTSPVPLPAPVPAPPRQRPSSDPVLAQPWADDVATMNRLLTALRALTDHAESS